MKTMISKRSKVKVLTRLVGFLMVGVVLAIGCAQQVGEIDQVQPNWIEKKDLEGEWYFKQTVIDNPYSSLYTFVGDQSPLERGTFDIQEDYLYLYRTYEFTENSNALGLKNDGDVPYLRWLEGDDVEYTPNPYQARDHKYAEGRSLEAYGGDAATVSCGGEKKMHEFCVDETKNSEAYCGHTSDVSVADRAAGNAVCVWPTKFVYRGAPLAVYPVSSHFDITYSYNPSTGEKTNVKKENRSDRYWYEQEFMRVNFADNQVPNYQFSMASQMLNVIVSIYEGDAAMDEEDGMRVFRDEEGATEYFDYVSRYIVEAPTEYYEYWDTDIPSCIFYPWYLGGILECTSEEIRTRNAFMKVEEDDYIPRYYDDHEMDKFGYFRQERLSFDDLYDTTYSGVIRYVQRFDIWDNHVLKDDGTEDYAQMTPKPVVYYLSREFPREYVEGAKASMAQWAVPLDETVAFLKGQDAVPASGMVVLCENNNAVAQEALDAGMPVAETDPEICQDMEYAKLNGDPRYSLLYAVNHALQSSPLGYGPSSSDPLTGKTISASAYLYLGSLRLYANYAADMIEAAVGFTDYLSLVEGVQHGHDDYIKQISVNDNPPPQSIEEAQSRAEAMVRPGIRTRLTNIGFEKADMNWAGMRMDMIRQAPELEKSLVFDAFRYLFRDPGAMYNAPLTDDLLEDMSLRKWANYRGIQKDRELLVHDGVHRIDREGFADPAIMGIVRDWKLRYDEYICEGVMTAMENDGMELAFNTDNFNIVKDACTAELEGTRRNPDANPGLPTWQEYDPTEPNDGDTCMRVEQGDVNGYYWVNTCTVAKLGAQISKKITYTEADDQLGYWKPSPWFADTKDDVVGKTQAFVRGLAEDLRAEIIEETSHKLFFALATHELGHNFGLRHNFEASTDAMNYPKEYWSMRGQETGDGYVVTDPFGAETDYQVKNGLREYQYSSVMDYGSKFNDLWLGLGHYDHAAIKYGYGGIVEVFKDDPDLAQYEVYLQDPSDQDPSLLEPIGGQVYRLEKLFKRVHYSQIPNVLGSVDKIYEREDVLLKDIIGNTCTSDDDCSSGVCVLELGEKRCMSDTQVQVPYRFCGDEYAYRTPYCDVWDAGADPYEIVRNAADDYWWYWPFWGRWRGKITFSHEKYADRVMRTFNGMKNQFQWWAVQYSRFNQDGWWEKLHGVPWDQDINGGLAGSMAAYQAFTTLTQVFAIPSADDSRDHSDARRYGFNSKNNRYETWTAYNDNDLQNLFILEEDYGKFAARPMYPIYYLTGDEAFPIAGGAIYDRLNAFMALCDPTTDFLNIEEYPDIRDYNISFFNVFPDQMLNLLGGLTTHEEENYAACVVEDENGDPSYLKLRTPETFTDPNFCSDGHFLEPEEVDYDFPTTWFRIPMLAAYYGMSLMINNYDRRYMDTTRVFLKGHEDALELPADVPRVELEDPLSGKVFVAYKMGESNEFDAAWTLVNRGKQLFDSYETEEELQEAYASGGDMHKIIGLLELLRGLHKVYDYTATGPVVIAPED